MKSIIHSYSRPREGNDFDMCEQIFIVVDLPFVPTKGVSLKVTPHSDFLTVEHVMWNFSRPDEIDVFTSEPEEEDIFSLQPFQDLFADGWRVGPGENYEERV